MKPLVCNYYLTFRTNDLPEHSSLWREKELLGLGESGEEVVKRNFQSLVRLGVKKVAFEGGEPLLREDLPSILGCAAELGIKVSLTTNAILFKEKAASIAPHLKQIRFWLDSPLEEEHNRIRGAECYREVMEGLDLARTLGLIPLIRFALTRDSVRFLPELAEWAEAKKVRVWLDPVYDRSYEPPFFEGMTLEHIKYFKRHPFLEVNFAVLEFIRQKGNRIHWPRCRAVGSVATIFPDNTLVFPCFYLPKKRVPLQEDLLQFYARAGFLREQEKKEGSFAECQGCMAFPYMLPSFQRGFDRYYWLQRYSTWLNQRKKVQR